MYKCGNCGANSLPKEPAYSVVVESRTKKYPRRENVGTKLIDEKYVSYDDPGGVGSEAVRVQIFCKRCAQDAIADQIIAEVVAAS